MKETSKTGIPQRNEEQMPVSMKGLKLILAGVVVMIAGYILMAGGGVKDPEVFNYDMFDFRRLVAAPIVILAGLATIVVGIMGNFKSKKN